MFAVVKTGGKQYKVQSGDILRVERLAANAGDKVQFNQILMLGGDKTVLGAPLVVGAAVQADVIDQIKSEKTIKFVLTANNINSIDIKSSNIFFLLINIPATLMQNSNALNTR